MQKKKKVTSEKGERKPILRFVPCTEGGFNLGNSQLAPLELCGTCEYFGGLTEDELGIYCSRDVGRSLMHVARGVRRKLGGLLKIGRVGEEKI